MNIYIYFFSLSFSILEKNQRRGRSKVSILGSDRFEKSRRGWNDRNKYREIVPWQVAVNEVGGRGFSRGLLNVQFVYCFPLQIALFRPTTLPRHGVPPFIGRGAKAASLLRPEAICRRKQRDPPSCCCCFFFFLLFFNSLTPRSKNRCPERDKIFTPRSTRRHRES